ncbi:immunoglobulin gamma-1 heavy chain-like [Mustelus asterias]
MGLLALGALFHLLPVIFSQVVFPQTPAVLTVSAGSRFEVHCHTGWFASAVVYWYKQRHHEHLQFVHIVRKHIPGDGRFSGAVNSDSTVYTLIIEDVERNDSGIYYCAARKSNGMSFIFGNGSKLLTIGPPTIFLLGPPPAEILSMETVPLMCLVSGATSLTLPVHWNVSTRETEGRTDSGVIDSTGVYSIRSQLTVPRESCSKGAVFICSVQTTTVENLISEGFSCQQDPLESSCNWLLYGGSLVMIVLLMIFAVMAGWNCRNRRSGTKTSRNAQTGSWYCEQNEETLYAHLDFTEASTL